MRIPVLLVTYNRIVYSKKALSAIVENAGVPIELNIWDNGSREDTQNWLRSIKGNTVGVEAYWNAGGGDCVIADIILNAENKGLAAAMNWFFRKYATQPYVVKVDNDTVLPKDWLKDLLYVMETRLPEVKLGAVSPTCLRPSGPTFDQWVKESMVSVPFLDHQLHFNSYVLGTGVLINMDMIRELGLLFEYFPYGPNEAMKRAPYEKYAKPDRTCLISGWTAYTRIACDYHGWKFAFYSKVHANLLNLKAEHVLSNDYPEYDEELKDARDQGNKWWESVGGLPGVKKYVEEHGGLERLTPIYDAIKTRTSIRLEHGINCWCYACDTEYQNDKALMMSGERFARHLGGESLESIAGTPRRYLTDCDQHYERSTQAWWEERVRKEGVSRAIFLDQTQARTNEFTERHLQIIRHELKGLKTLEVGCGWGRMSADIAKVAESYIGTDFVEQLLVVARETLPKLDFRYADAGALPFAAGEFDAVVAVTCVSSFDERFDAVLKEMLRVVNKDGFVLLLEEEWSRKQWKLEHK